MECPAFIVAIMGFMTYHCEQRFIVVTGWQALAALNSWSGEAFNFRRYNDVGQVRTKAWRRKLLTIKSQWSLLPQHRATVAEFTLLLTMTGRD